MAMAMTMVSKTKVRVQMAYAGSNDGIGCKSNGNDNGNGNGGKSNGNGDKSESSGAADGGNDGIQGERGAWSSGVPIRGWLGDTRYQTGANIFFRKYWDLSDTAYILFQTLDIFIFKPKKSTTGPLEDDYHTGASTHLEKIFYKRFVNCARNNKDCLVHLEHFHCHCHILRYIMQCKLLTTTPHSIQAHQLPPSQLCGK